ncbi:SDR family NAD(P)-dependent oxidoreductase [Nonomuraea sp. NPDC004297]
MKAKTAVITGSTGGIGKEIARGLALRGASVVLVGLDPAAGRKAVHELSRAAGHDRIEALAADITTLDGLTKLASQIAERTDRLDVLVNNVGLNPPARQLTADGVERTFAAHVLAPFTLTHCCCRTCARRATPGSSTSPAGYQAARSSATTCRRRSASWAGRSASTTTPRR